MRHFGDGEWARGWKAAAAGAVGTSLTAMPLSATGVMMKPLGDAFGWSRAEVSASSSLYLAFLLFTGPVVGLLVDRYGPRRVSAVGLVLYCLGILGVSQAGPSIWSWYLAWGFVGVVFAAASSVIWTAAVTRHFDRQRGLALALAMSGTGVGGFLGPTIAARAVEAGNWSAAYLTIGLVGLLVALPAVWFLLREAPASPDDAPRTHAMAIRDADGLERPQILRARSFWTLAVTILLVGAGLGAVFPHFVSIVTDAGVPREQAALFIAAHGPSLIAGRLLGGILLDRLNERLVAAASFLLPAVTCTILLLAPDTPSMALLAAILLGVSIGAEGDVLAYLTARYFGRRNYAWAYGILYAAFALAFGLAPVLTGAAHDALGTYQPILIVLGVALVLAAGMAASLGRPPGFASARREPEPVPAAVAHAE